MCIDYRLHICFLGLREITKYFKLSVSLSKSFKILRHQTLNTPMQISSNYLIDLYGLRKFFIRIFESSFTVDKQGWVLEVA